MNIYDFYGTKVGSLDENKVKEFLKKEGLTHLPIDGLDIEYNQDEGALSIYPKFNNEYTRKAIGAGNYLGFNVSLKELI